MQVAISAADRLHGQVAAATSQPLENSPATVAFLWGRTFLMRQQNLGKEDERLLQGALTEVLWEIAVAMSLFAKQSKS